MRHPRRHHEGPGPAVPGGADCGRGGGRPGDPGDGRRPARGVDGDTGGEFTIREAPVDPKALQGVDVVLFAGDRLGDLVDAGALVVLPESTVQPPRPPDSQEGSDDPPEEPDADPLQFSDVVPAYRDQVTKYGSDRMGLPYGGTALVLAYDRTAFEGEANREAAARRGLTLEAPRDLGAARRPGRVLPGARLGRRRHARSRDRPGAGPRRRRGGRRDLPGAGGEPGAAPRPVLVPLRRRLDGPSDRVAAVRRGADATWWL